MDSMDTGTDVGADQETPIFTRTREIHIHQPAGFPIPVSNTSGMSTVLKYLALFLDQSTFRLTE